MEGGQVVRQHESDVKPAGRATQDWQTLAGCRNTQRGWPYARRMAAGHPCRVQRWKAACRRRWLHAFTCSPPYGVQDREGGRLRATEIALLRERADLRRRRGPATEPPRAIGTHASAAASTVLLQSRPSCAPDASTDVPMRRLSVRPPRSALPLFRPFVSRRFAPIASPAAATPRRRVPSFELPRRSAQRGPGRTSSGPCCERPDACDRLRRRA